MADKHIADGEAAFKAVSSAPDVCIVGIDPVPFDSFQTLINQKQYASTVWARGYSVLNVGSVIAGSQGNTGAGVVSGTSLASGDCVILTGSPSVFIEGKAAARHGSQVGMNNMNCVGSLYTLVEPPLIRVKDNAIPCNNPPISSAALEQMKAKKEEMKKSLLASARNFVDVSDSLKSGDVYAKESIDKLRPGKIEGAGSAGDVLNASNEIGAGVVRGALGLGWDLVSGVEHLANSAVQFGLSATTDELSLDAAILEENIRLGNICADGILQDAKKTLNAAKKAAAEEWDKASHASLGDQAEMATQIFGLIASFFVGAGEAKVAGSVSKASEAARADETINTLDKAGDVVDASKVDSDGVIVKKAYSNPKNRPKYAKGQIEQVWENAKGPDGRVYDPNTGEELFWDKSEKRNWDMGHLPGEEYRILHQRYMDGELTTEEFLSEYKDASKYRPESQSSNRSRKYEEK